MFTRRLGNLYLLACLMLLVQAGRLFHLQVLSTEEDYAGKARSRRDVIGKTLTPQEIVQAHQMTNALIAKSAPPAPPPPRVTETFADRVKDLR